MDRERSLKLWALVLFLALSALISFAFFNASVSVYQRRCEKIESNIQRLVFNVDSLEKVINTTFKERKDTILIQVVPQEVKIYCNKDTKWFSFVF